MTGLVLFVLHGMMVLQGCRVQEVRQVFSDWASLGRVTWHDGVTGLSCSGGPSGVQ